MRHFRSVLVSLLGSALSLAPVSLAAVPAPAVELVRVWPSYRDAASFTRLGEYFGAAPDAINRAALRTDPDARAGFYWLIRTATPAARPDCQLTLEVQRLDAAVIERHTFPVDLPAGSQVLNAGITGRDWADPSERPVAWRITLTSPEGVTLVSATSFLWAPPAS